MCITVLQCVSHQLSVINMHNQLSMEQNSAYLSKHGHLHDKEKLGIGKSDSDRC